MQSQNTTTFYMIRDCEDLHYWSGRYWVSQKTDGQKYFEIKEVLTELPYLKQGGKIVKNDGMPDEKIVHQIA